MTEDTARRADRALVLPTYRRDDVDVHPPLLSPDYRSTVARAPPGSRWSSAAAADRDHRAAARRGPVGDARPRPDPPARRASRIGQRIIVHGRVLDGDGRAGARHAGGDLAGQRRRPVPPRERHTGRPRSTRTSPASAAALTDAGAATGSSPSSPGAYPWRNHHNAWRPAHIHFSPLRPGVHPAAGHADVLPGRPALLPGPDLQLGPRQRPGSGWSPATTTPPPRRSGRWPTSSTSCCAAGMPPRSRTATTMSERLAVTPVADRRAVPAHRAALARRPVRRPRGHPGRVLDPGPDRRRHRRHRWSTRWWRAGRPTRTAGSTTRTTRAGPARASRASADSAAARPTTRAATGCSPSGRVRCPTRTAAPRPPT